MERYNKTNTRSHTSLDYYRLKLSKSKLKAVTRTSALLSGFAMVAMVELGLDYSSLADETLADELVYEQHAVLNFSTNATTHQMIKTHNNKNDKFVIPHIVLIVYALVTCLLVGVHMLALMISTCILPQIEALSFEGMQLKVFKLVSLTLYP